MVLIPSYAITLNARSMGNIRKRGEQHQESFYNRMICKRLWFSARADTGRQSWLLLGLLPVCAVVVYNGTSCG